MIYEGDGVTRCVRHQVRGLGFGAGPTYHRHYNDSAQRPACITAGHMSNSHHL